MPIDKLALILTILAVILWGIGMLIGIVAAGPVGLLILVPVAIAAYVFGVVISQRLNNREDDHYDKVER